MNEPSDTKRLADATAALAGTILEIIDKRLQAQPRATVQEQQLVQKVSEPFVTAVLAPVASSALLVVMPLPPVLTICQAVSVLPR